MEYIDLIGAGGGTVSIATLYAVWKMLSNYKAEVEKTTTLLFKKNEEVKATTQDNKEKTISLEGKIESIEKEVTGIGTQITTGLEKIDTQLREINEENTSIMLMLKDYKNATDNNAKEIENLRRN